MNWGFSISSSGAKASSSREMKLSPSSFVKNWSVPRRYFPVRLPSAMCSEGFHSLIRSERRGKDPIVQVLLSQFPPEMFDRVDFWTISGLKDQADIRWYPQFFGPVPACLIDLHDKKVVGKVLGHLRQKEIHHLGIGVRQDEGGHQAMLWCHRRIDIARLANDLSGCLWADAWRIPGTFGTTEAAKAPLVLGHL